MNVTYRIDKDILYIALDGRIDATNAAEAEEKIFNIKNENPEKHTVIDADKLEYISSAGIRVLLAAYKKMNSNQGIMWIEKANDMVREVFEMTGLLQMLDGE